MNLDDASSAVWEYLTREGEKVGKAPHEVYAQVYQNDEKFRRMLAAYRRVWNRTQEERIKQYGRGRAGK